MKCLLLFVLLTVFTCPKVYAQTYMRIHHKGGEYCDIPIDQIDSLTFVNNEETPDNEASLTGSWFWGDTQMGYYELLTFNGDKTYTGYDNYFTYGFDAMTYGWYMQIGGILTLRSSGFGYNRRYNWFIMGLTDNALDVMTKMGRFVYYRLQQETIHLQQNGEPLTCKDGDYFVFADGVMVCIEEDKLQGIAKGTTYVLKYNSETNCIVAYKVVVR